MSEPSSSCGEELDVDTIAALATAPGFGAIAVVRVSGSNARSLLGVLAPDLDVDALVPREATLTRLCSPEDGSVLDQALVTWFRGPDSYTGEDVVEISCHGGWLVPRLVVEACEMAGARPAEPGEFTRRAYLRGRMDLVQAEAVDDVIHARSRALHRTALGQLERGLSERIGALRSSLIDLEAVLAHHIDFPEEDDAPVPLTDIQERAAALVARIDAMLATAPEGELLREGALVVLAGKPNAGKSSLYNALLGDERAIVTEEAGTTRDAIEAAVELGGYPFRLVDTAGLREAGGRIERLGIEVTRRYLARADLVLFCTEAAAALEGDEEVFLGEVRDRPVVLVETKADLADREGAADGSAAGEDGGESEGSVTGLWMDAVRVSVRTGEGLDRLRGLLPGLVYKGLVTAEGDVPVITRRRHARALREAREEVAAFGRGLAEGVPPEVASAHLKTAESALEEVVGVISTEDVLDAVFRQFCVGK